MDDFDEPFVSQHLIYIDYTYPGNPDGLGFPYLEYVFGQLLYRHRLLEHIHKLISKMNNGI